MVTLFVVICSFLIFTVLMFLALMPFINLFNEGLNFEDLTNPHIVLVLKYMQVIQTFGLFIIPSLILSYLFSGNAGSVFNYGINPKYKTILILVLVMIIAIPFMNLLVELNSRMKFPGFLSSVEKWMRNSEDSAARLTDAFLKAGSIKGLLLNVFIIGLMPAIGEELIFRGILQRIFVEWTKSRHWGIIISALIFSAIHLQFYGFIPRFLLGAFFGYLLEWSGTIWLPIIAHFVNNAFSVIVSYFVNARVLDGSIENIGSDSSTLFLSIFSLILTSFLVIVIYRWERQKEGIN